MSEINIEKLNNVWRSGWQAVDYNVCKNMQMIFVHLRGFFPENSQSLNESEKTELTNRLNSFIDKWNVEHQESDTEPCGRCQNLAYASQYCEHCIRRFFKKNFGNWTSGNDEIDKVIQDAQLNASCPDMVIEWIPYDSFEKVEYKTKGHHSTIYSATWNNGPFDKFNPETQEVDRLGKTNVILKKLKTMDGNWFKVISECKLHRLSIFIANFYGITKDPETQEYMLVLKQYDYDLHKFISINHSKSSWFEKIYRIYQVIAKIEGVNASSMVHKNLQPGSVHGNLHPGNILYHEGTDHFYVSDLGFYRSANDCYVNLPFIAPEVLEKKQPTLKSDVYSVGMIMWEFISGEPPFKDRPYDANLAQAIINGERPKIVDGTPPEYAALINECLDADPEKRPDLLNIFMRSATVKDQYKD